MTTVTIVRPTLADKPAWRRLYDGYARFYKRPMNDAKANLVWSWIQDPNHPVECLLARADDGAIVGLAHVREYPRPLLGGLGGYLDDLFVDPARRGGGIVDLMFAAVAELAAERGWISVQWKTAEDNYRARAVYDRVGRKTHWITYEMDPAQSDAASDKKPIA